VIGTAEPADLVSAMPNGWIGMGYTFEGHQFASALTLANVEVAEELDPLFVVPTTRVVSVKFISAELTARNLQRQQNGGLITAASGCYYFDPPAAGVPVMYMYAWQSDDGLERRIYRQCINGGSGTTDRKKGADKAGLPFELICMKPAGLQPFRVIVDPTRY
jgi:hypothetical protein